MEIDLGYENMDVVYYLQLLREYIIEQYFVKGLKWAI